MTRRRLALLLLPWLLTAAPALGDEIHDVARCGDLPALESLLAAEPALLDAPDELGHTPLTLAAAYGRWDCFRFLLDAGADVRVITRTGSSVLHTVCYHDRPDMVELLLERGGEGGLRVRDVFGDYSPLLRAVQLGNAQTIALLLERGARVDEITREGWNPLHLAARCGHRPLYGLLVDAGVSLDAFDREGKRPMEYDRGRPEPIAIDPERLPGYVGRYCWKGDANGPGVDVFLDEGGLVLDDNSLSRLDPIADDTFYCRRNPWRVSFLRNEEGSVDAVELGFLRRDVRLTRVPTAWGAEPERSTSACRERVARP